MSALVAVLLVEMVVNVVVSFSWAYGSLLAARREGAEPTRPFAGARWAGPLRRATWRWLVFWWMFTKACMFAILAVAIHPRSELPDWLAEAVVASFTVAHTLAFLGWLALPAAEPARRDAK